ncbi:hypothetical protein B0T16DRAFT_409209 [Cercophora newfieldiana]|uniref:Uncharacterized protein n=1 Tax=Cercophora newfieldiana TaxID=92897 RepID=A0AA39YAC7_9PEZI|nr:hypothetical protein B0T16DRAFT_409209 [Cercophora newfieldiana]
MKGVAGRAAGYWFGGERSAVRRWVEVGLVFGISGVLQVVMDWKRGWCNPWGSGWFYFVQPVGFVLEDVAMGIWAMGLREKVAVRVGKGRELRRFEQVVGYLWVWGWFWWLYPRRTILEIECLRRRT